MGQLYGTTGGVENCLNRASVKGGQYVGGIVGYVAGGYSSDEKFIKNCGNVGDVTSKGHRAAGIAANISGQVAVENCYSTGTITGGWYSGGISAYVDSSYASVKNCYAAGSVTGSGAGAVFGKVSYSSTVVANCYYPDTLSVGDSKAVKVTEQQLKTLDSAAALGEAFMQDAKSINGGYPILTWQITTYEVTFTVTPEDAEVRIDGAKGKQNGNVWTFRLPEGTYSYTAFAFGYADESGNIEVSGAARKDITLTPVEKRTVRFSVTPEDAGAAVTVQWNGKTVAAEQDGSYRLPDGTYTYTVRAKGYAKVSQTLKVSGDVTVPVTLEPSAAWDGQTVTAPEAGDGTEASPYEIENGEQLAWLARTVNAGNGSTKLYAVLTEDIDLGDGVWTPIGADSHEFTGRFDGQGHTVSRMKAEAQYAGLFGVVKDAEIRGVVVQGIAAGTDSSSGASVDWYKTLSEALAAVKTLSAGVQDAALYTVRLYQDAAEDVSINGGKFTLDLNGHKAGNTAFTAGGSAAVILSGGEVSCNMQVRDTADLTVNGTVLRDVELYGSAKLTANGAAMGHLQTRDGTPAEVTGGTISRITMRAGTVGLTGSVTVENQTEVLSGGVLTVTAQSGEPEFRNAVTIGDGGKLVASAGKFRSNVEFGIGAKGELSGGEYGGLECGGDQLLKDMLKTGYAYFGIEHLENGYVNSLMSQSYTVRPHSNHSYEWDATTHEKKCGCGDVSETDTAAPVIGFLNGAALKTENGRQVMDVTDNVIYTVTDANEVKVTVSYGSGTAAEVRPDAGGRYELPLSEGDGKPVTITAADEAGNVTTVTFTLYRLVDMRISSHVGVAVEETDLTRTVRSGQTYTLRVTMLPGYTGEDGLELEQGALTTKQRFTGSDAAGYTVQVTADFNNSLLRIVGAYDNTPPTAEITIRNSSFRNFLNRISFGLFFKETQTVSVTAADVGAGLDKAEYLLSGTAFTREADAGAADGWTALTLDTDGRGSFTVAPNSKGFLYVKAIDREGNVTVVNADGMVVYTDAEQITERVSFAEASADDCVFRVKDNGSTVRSITMGSRALVRDTEYRIGASANGQLAITLTNSFLTALTAGSYTLTVSYDPLGETYVSGGDNQAPASTTVVLTVGRSTVDADIASMDKIYDSEPVTPSANTESDGVMTWEFKPDGADPGAYTTAAPEDAGTYNVRLTVAETEHYDRIEKTATFTISPKDVQLHTPALEDKTYDGSTAIVCMYYYPERAMEGKISGDDLSVVMGQANADSPDVGRRTVTFTGFGLTGSDAANYRLTAQPISGSAAITARPLSIGSLTVRDKLYDGLNTAAIEGTPTLVNLADGETLMLRCGTPTFDTVAAGDNIPVSFTEFTIADSANGKAGNYSLTQPAGITASIKAYTATGAEYTAGTGQWTNQDFMVTAADGWQVSGTNTANGDWRGSLTRSDETGTGSLTFYVKNTADGYISESVTLTYKIDKTDPTGEIRIDQRNAWQSFWNTISFDLFYKSRQTVTLTAADEASGVTAIEYLLSEEDYTAAQLDGMTLQPYTAPVAITPDSRLIAYARITDAAGNVTYLRSDGVVLDAAAPVIAGVDDGAVYCGNVTFTVTDAYLDTVTVDGTAAVSVPGRAAGSTYIIEADSQLHTIVATDRAGNSTQVQITVNDGHTVGTPATCKAPAVCRYCGESFGGPAPGNHGGLLRRVDKVNATSTADGNIEYWYCSGCGKYYLDAAAGREITRRDTILPAIGLRIVDDVRVWRPGDKPLGVTFRQEYDDFTAQIDGVTVDPANYEVTADPDGGRLIVTFRAQFLRTLAFGERTITIVSDDGSASVSFRRDSARAVTSGGKDGGKAGVTSAATGDGFPMGGMAAALLVSGSALVMLTTRARRKEEE